MLQVFSELYIRIICETQNKGKERENSYQKLKRSPKEWHNQTHGSLIKYFDGHRRLSQSEENT